ncbi:MAG: PAS domain S-box protein, partial [Cyanobacteriota bacterium]|nr:PAS domain S-box protein [Cyanobacteriota bacterium]
MTEPMNPHVALKSSENYLSQSFLLEIINSVSDPIFVKNRQHQWIFINNAFCQLTGYDSEELIGKSDYDFFSDEEAEVFRETDELIFTSGVSNNSEGYFSDAEGKVYFIPIQKTLFDDEFGNQFIICSIKEIRASENKPRKEEKLNNISLSVVKAIKNLLSISDIDESFNAVLETLGSATEVQQISIIAVNDNQSWEWSSNDFKIEFDILPRWHEILCRGETITGSINDFPESEREILNAANIRSTLVIPIQVADNFWGYIRFDNCQKESEWLDRNQSILQAAAESLGAAIYHHQQQEKLVKSKDFLQLVVDSIPQIIFWKDCNSVFLGCNQRLADIWNLNSVEEIAGKTDDDVSTPQEKSQWYKEWDKRVIESGVPELHIIEKKQQADGKQKWLDTNKIPLLDEQNNVVGLLATIEDITERKQVEETLGQKEEFLRTIYDGIELGIIVYEVTEENTFNYFGINKATELLSGYQSQQMVGKTPSEVLGEDFGGLIEKRNLDCSLKKESVSFEEIVKTIDKEMFLLTTLTPLLDERGRVYRIISTSTDITAQKQAETTLRESEEKFHQLSTNVPGMLYKFKIHSDGSMSFPYVSPGSYELLGIAAEKIQTESNLLISMIHSEDYKTFEKSLNNSAETFEPFYWEGRLVQSSEKIQWIKAESRPQRQLDGSIIWDGFISDITHLKETKQALQKAYGEMESLVLKRTKELTRTNKALKAEIEERKNTEAVLRETEAKVQKLAANVPGMLYQFEVNPDGVMSFPYVSSGCYDIYGLQPEQIQADANTIISMIHPDDFKSFETSLAISMNNLKPLEHEGRIVIPSGEVKWIKSHSRSEKLENGTILYHGLILDTTERKQAEKALLRSNAMLEAQQEAAIDGILFVDENQKVLSCNQHFVELWQIPQSVIETGDEQQFLASIIGKFTNLGEFVDEVEDLYNDVEKSVRDEIDLGDGRTFERYCAPVNSALGEYFGRVWYFRDITERKAAEKSLLRTNSVLKAQQEASIDGILVVDEHRESISYNQRFLDLWQIPQSTIETGKHEAIFASMLEKSENPEEFVSTLEYIFEHPDKSCRNEIHLKDGKTLERYIASVLSLAGDNYGKIFYFRDITERKQAEAKLRQQTQELENALQKLQRTQVQLIQSEKMSSLGQLVAGIAHEINNPVNFIDANLTYTQEYFEDLLKLIEIYQSDSSENLRAEAFIEEIDFDYLEEDLPKIINSMKTGAKRIGDIVLSLRTFSRLDEAEFKSIDIHESIDSTLMVLQKNLEQKSGRFAIVVTKEFNNIPLVECFAGKLNQVFLNILNNAIDAL